MKMTSLKDVARFAGVSTATVSRVLNDYVHVDQTTREKVLHAIEALDYKPSRVARRLRKQGSQILGLLIADILNPYYLSIIERVEDISYENKFSIVLCNLGEDPHKEKIYTDILVEERVAGIILSPVDENSILCENFLKQGIPVVAIDRRFNRVNVDTVLIDNVMGAYQATSHLIRLGHERIGLIAGPAQLITGRERREGYVKAILEHGLNMDECLIEMGDFKQNSGYKLAYKLLDTDKPPTAIFVSNNLMTLGALNAIHEMGLQIPSDVAVVGFDDLPWAQSLNPPLTVVDQPTHKLGEEAVNLLLQRISGDRRDPIEIRLKPTLKIRVSCGYQGGVH